MWYAIIAEDHDNSLQQRMAARPAHLARLQQLQAADRLLLAGPFPVNDSNDPGTSGYSGSLIIADFVSLEAARAWAQADPYVDAGVYANVAVKPFRQTLPTPTAATNKPD